MGKGSLYRYPHFMLIDTDEFLVSPTDPETGEPDASAPAQWDTSHFEEFKDRVVQMFKAQRLDPEEWLSREAYIFAESQRLRIGIDWTGDLPCIFVVPRTYGVLRFHGPYSHWIEKTYQIDREVIRVFNKLIQEHNCFRFPTTPWTSVPLARYERYAS